MIKVEIYRDEKGLITGYSVSGHAGYDEAGYDIVCSAVSALTQAPLMGLERYLKRRPQYSVDQKSGRLTAALNSAPDELTQAILETMLCGVGSIVRQYPKYVSIEEHRR